KKKFFKFEKFILSGNSPSLITLILDSKSLILNIVFCHFCNNHNKKAMILNLKYDPQAVMELFIKDLLCSMGIPYNTISAYEIQFGPQANKEQIKAVSNFLANFNIEISKDHKEHLVLRVKQLIWKMIVENSSEKTAEYLSRHLGNSYRYL